MTFILQVFFLCRAVAHYMDTCRDADGLICHFGDELDAYESDFVFRVVFSEFVHGGLQVIRFRFAEILVYLINVVFVYHLFKEVVDVKFGARVYYGLHFREQVAEFYAFCVCYVVERYLSVYALDDAYFQH